MSFLKTLISRHFQKLPHPQNPPQTLTVFLRPISSSPQIETHFKPPKKPLDIFFKEALGLSENPYESDPENEIEHETQNSIELKSKLRTLESDIRRLKAKSESYRNRVVENFSVGKSDNVVESKISHENVVERKSLYGLFAKPASKSKFNSKSKPESKVSEPISKLVSEPKSKLDSKSKSKSKRNFISEWEPEPKSESKLESELELESESKLELESKGLNSSWKEFSPEMVTFMSHLYKEGYFKNANFLEKGKFDVIRIEDSYSRDFVKCAAERFGRDNQEIAKWLSGSYLKTVALFGCPSFSRRRLFAAKRLRIFFSIQENTVCSKCVLKTSCKFVNQSVWKGDKNLRMVDVLNVIILYALGATHPELVVPDDVKTSVNRLLMEALKLSETTS